jgi:hypothetical protein
VARTESPAAEAAAIEPEHYAVRPVAWSPARVRRWALAGAVLVLLAIATWLISPRFEIASPSLVDDWAAIAKAPGQVADIVRLRNPEPQRFRLSWIVWNELQWHTLDAPFGLVGPNVWNLLRTLVLVAGLVLATALALPPPKSRLQALVHAGLAATPALLVVTVPKFAVELARFGPQEPLLLGGMALGGALLVIASRLLLDAEPHPAWQAWAAGVAGSVFWILGVYQKEASLAVVPLIAATLYAGRARLARWPSLEARRKAALVVIGAAVVVPLVHVAVVSAWIVARGDLVYDAEVDKGRGVWRGLHAEYDWLHEVFPMNALRITLLALVVVVAATIVLRRVDLVAVGALASGALTLLLAAQAGVVANRYFLPAAALAVAALVISLARLPAAAQVAGLAVLAFVAYPSFLLARSEVSSWTDHELADAAFVDRVADAHATGCPVAVGDLDAESQAALPVLVAWERRPVTGSCVDGRVYLVFRPDSAALARACATGADQPLLEYGVAGLYRCTRIGSEPVRDPRYGVVAPARLVELRRLRPSLSADQ